MSRALCLTSPAQVEMSLFVEARRMPIRPRVAGGIEQSAILINVEHDGRYVWFLPDYLMATPSKLFLNIIANAVAQAERSRPLEGTRPIRIGIERILVKVSNEARRCYCPFRHSAKFNEVEEEIKCYLILHISSGDTDR